MTCIGRVAKLLAVEKEGHIQLIYLTKINKINFSGHLNYIILQ